MIYLAGPYSDPDPFVRELRFIQLTNYAAELVTLDIMVISPITHSHPIAVVEDLPTGWDYWSKLDFALMTICDEMRVLKMPG